MPDLHEASVATPFPAAGDVGQSFNDLPSQTGLRFDNPACSFHKAPQIPCFPCPTSFVFGLKTHPLIYRMTHGADDFWSSLTGRRRAFPLAIRRRSPPTHRRTAAE